MNPKPYLVAAALLAAAGIGMAGQKVEQSQLPAEVRQTLEQHASAANVEEVTMRTDAGRTVYEAKLAGSEARLVIAADGSVIEQPSVDANTTSAVSSATYAPSVATGSTTVTGTATPAANQVAVTQDEELMADTESRLALEEVPQAVRETIEREANGREIADIDREMHEDRAIFEVEFREQGINQQIHVEEDGTLVRDDGAIRRTVRNLLSGTEVGDTPMVVQDVIKRELEGREIADIDKERRSGEVVYEVEVDDDQGQFQLHIAEDGTIVKDGRIAAE